MARVLPDRIVAVIEERLAEVVRAALDEPSAELDAWDAVPLKAETGPLAARSVYRLEGTARVGLDVRAWSVVIKVIPPPGDAGDATRDDNGRRELLLYRTGLLDDLPGGLSAPRCHGAVELADGTVWLWLERVREAGERAWPIERWALAGRHLGQFNGAYLTQRPLPIAPGLEGGRLRVWLGRHAPLVERISVASDNPAVRQWWPRPVVEAIRRLWEERDVFCAALERLSQTFGHGDAIRRNLFARRRPDGSEETVAIDWEHAGYYAVGEEVGQTLSVASAFFDLEPADLPALDEALFAGYLAGLGDLGWSGDPRLARFAYAAHAALRNAFNAVGATVPGEAGRTSAKRAYGRSWEELAERRAAVRPFLLARADEARRLRDSLAL